MKEAKCNLYTALNFQKVLVIMIDYHVLDALKKIGYCIELIDQDEKILYYAEGNNKIEDIPLNVVGKQLSDVFNFEGGNKSVLLETLKTGRPRKNVFYCYRSGTNQEYYWLMDAVPIYKANKIVGALGISKPYSEFKKVFNNSELNNPFSTTSINPFYSASIQHAAVYTFENIIHQCHQMKTAISAAKNIAKSLSSVLLIGETGTGKELFAQSIHNESPHTKGPFVALNCNAIPDTLLESTLFGTSKGAYTGAVEKKGLCEEAANGTLFLDEINSISLEMQAKLLRFLEEKTFRRVGSNYEVKSNARIISATNISPLEAVKENKLRLDLFYRLAVVTVEIPPLRQRNEDIILLANTLLSFSRVKLNKKLSKFSAETLEMFKNYQWPGNVRELQHIIEHATTIVIEDEITLQKQHLPYYFIEQFKNFHQPSNPAFVLEDYKSAKAKELARAEREFARTFLTASLIQHSGNISKAAEALNISRQHLHRLIKEYTINYEDMVKHC